MAGLDLSKLDTATPAEEGSVVELEHPATGEPLRDPETKKPITVTLRGKDSPAVQAVANKQWDRRQERIRRQKSHSSAAVVEADSVEVLVAATISWSGIALDGEVLECTPENAYKVYSDDRFPWLVEQLSRALGDRERFFSQASRA